MSQSFRNAFRARYTTALVADAAYRAQAFVGVPRAGIYPLQSGHRIAGRAATVEANNDLVAVMVALHRALPGDVLTIANREGEAGLTGDILATEALRKGLAAILVDGYVRDTAEIRKMGQPVFCRGRVPIGPLKLPAAQKGIGSPGVSIQLGGVTVRPGDWIVGDDDGVLVLHAQDLDAIEAEAEKALTRERELTGKLQDGTPLGDIFGIEEFFRIRSEDPGIDFNDYLASRNAAI